MTMEQKNLQNIGTNSHDSSVGLVCHYQFENGSSEFIFLDIENQGVALVDHSLSFFTETFVQTLASSNGLMLWSGYNEDQSCYYVFNPLTKNSIKIPQPCMIKGHVVTQGLAYDGSSFEIVVIEAESSNSNGLELHIFSSETNNWRSTHHPINSNVPLFPQFEFQELSTTPLYSNGTIHLEISGHLLEYSLQGSHCELFELPNSFDDWSWQFTTTYRRCLWESNGNVYYCYTDFDGIHIWGLLKEHDHPLNACYDTKKFRWKLVQSVMHEVFISKYLNLFGSFWDWEPYKIAPIAYSEQAQTMYLQLPGSVVSYDFDTGDLRSICSYSYPGINFSCCIFLPSTTTSELSGVKRRERKLLKANEEKELNLPIAEMAKLSL